MQLEDSYKHRGMRRQLVKTLTAKGIKDPNVLGAIGRVPRHYFFDQVFLEHAYQDKAFPIGEGQTISQPYTVAAQTELLKVKPGDKVLEIGTGSGYQCCILLEMGADVFTIEYNRVLFNQARSFLKKIGYHAHFRLGDGTLGWPSFANFDKIIVTAGAPRIPGALKDQLNSPGSMVIPVGDTDTQKMILLKKDESGEFTEEEYDYYRFVPLIGKDGWIK